MAATPPTFVKVSDGYVVDYGLTWFRVRNSGEIVKRVAHPVRGVTTPSLKTGEAARIRKVLSNYLKAKP